MMCWRLNIILFVATVLFAFSFEAKASEPKHKEEDQEFDVKELVWGHVLDSHSWHLWDYQDKNGEKHAVSIPLPVILIHEGNIDVFMSSEFDHGHTVVNKGNRNYALYKGDIYLTDEEGTIKTEIDEERETKIVTNQKPLDFSVTKTVFGIFISAIILLLIFIPVAHSYKKRPGKPSGLQAFMEPIVLFVRDNMAKPNIGEKYHKFLPYILTVFFFILINNVLGLVPIFPGGANVTGNIAVTMTLAVFTMLVTNISANKHYWRDIFAAPGIPVWLYPLMIPVELIGVIAKPFALMVRLFANITAGHIIVLSLVSLIFIFKTAMMGFVSVPFVLFMDMLELLVAFIQAYIFTLLSALFIGLAVKTEH